MTVSTTLGGSITATAGVLHLADASGLTTFPTTLHIDAAGDAELVLARNIARNGEVQIDRGVFGSTRVAHSAGVTVTTYEPGGTGGGSGVTVDNTVDAPFAAATIVAPGATESAPGEATLARAVISPTDPGAIGAGSFWLDSAAGTDSLYPLFVRDPTDAYWLQASLGDKVTTDGTPVTRFAVVDGDANEIALFQLLTSGGLIRVSSAEGDRPESTVTISSLVSKLTHTKADNTTYHVEVSDAGIRVIGLPVTNPGLAGQIWNDADLSALKVADPSTADAEEVGIALNALIDRLAGTLKVSAG